MQHKQYFAALLCGVLCLTGCLKNEESASVTQVRNAKVNEINSVAALNNAKAAAETTLANAEAALKASEAKLNEAMATKTLAEAKVQEAQAALLLAQAALEQANADYRQLQLQLLAVQIEQEKITLEQMKVQLERDIVALNTDISNYERIIAQNQALIATANTTIADEALKLENVARQAEIDAVTYATALLAAQDALIAQEQLNAANEITYFTTILAAYNAALTRINTLQGLIVTEEGKIATLQAGLHTYVDTYDAAVKAQDKIIAQNQALIDALQKYVEMPEEELAAKQNEILPDLMDAWTDYQEKLNVFNDLVLAHTTGGKLSTGETVTGTLDQINNGTAFMADNAAKYATISAWALANGAKNVDSDPSKELYYLDADDNHVTLYIPQATEAANFYLSDEEASKAYKDLEDAGYTNISKYFDGYSSYANNKIEAAEYSAEGFEAFAAVVEKKAADKLADDLKKAADTRDKAIKAAEDNIADLNETKEYYKTFVAAVEEKYGGDVYATQKAADAANTAAGKAYTAALTDATAKFADDFDVIDAQKVVNEASDAQKAADAALNDPTKGAIAVEADLKGKIPTAIKNSTATAGYVYKTVDTGGDPLTPDWNFDRADHMYQTVIVDAKGAVETDDTAIDELKKLKGYKEVVEELDAAKGKYETGKAKLQELLEAFEAAELAWIKAGRPATGTLKDAKDDADADYKAQEAKLYTPSTGLYDKYMAAKDDWDKNDPYTYAKPLVDPLPESGLSIPAGLPGWEGALKHLTDKKAADQKTLDEGNAGYDKWATAAKKAISDWKAAEANIQTAKDNLDAANKALKDANDAYAEVAKDKAPTEQEAVKAAKKVADDAQKAKDAADAAATEVTTLYVNYKTYKDELAANKKDGGAYWAAGHVNFDIAAENDNITAAKDAYSNKTKTGAADVAQATYNTAKKAIDDNIKDVKEKDGQKEAYEELVAAYNAEIPALEEAWKAKETALIVKDAVDAEYQACNIANASYYDEKGVKHDKATDNVYTAIEAAEKAIVAAEDAKVKAYNTLVNSTDKDEAAIEVSKALIAQYEDEIAFQETLVEYYGAILDEFVPTEEEVPAE